MYVCTNGVNSTDSWPLHAFGQQLVKQHLSSLPAKARPLVRAQQPLALQRRLRLAAVVGSDRSATEPAVLSILFHRRGVNRMLLNAAELLERCNTWTYTTAAGVAVRARCSEVGRRLRQSRASAVVCPCRSNMQQPTAFLLIIALLPACR